VVDGCGTGFLLGDGLTVFAGAAEDAATDGGSSGAGTAAVVPST
jgi:hypothetical protein